MMMMMVMINNNKDSLPFSPLSLTVNFHATNERWYKTSDLADLDYIDQ